MPVRIQKGDNSLDPRVISLQDYIDGRANFSLHYYYTSAQASFGGQVIEIPWGPLNDAVQQYMDATETSAEDVAMRFVHCFDPGPAGELYLRLQICKLVPTADPPPPGVEQVFLLDTTDATWYSINNGSLEPTDNQDLYGTEYLNNFYYKFEPQAQEMEVLAAGPDKYVKNLVLPWGDEILKVYQQNGSPANANINFAACSYISTPEHANVEWPHGMVIFLSNNQGEPYLDNNNYISIFHNKGADYGSLCPPNCNVYLKPSV